MKKQTGKKLRIAVCMLALFVLWTVAVSFIDVKPIGPHKSAVGFATLNRCVHEFTGVHMNLYVITDWLGLVPCVVVIGFGILGLTQWISGKHILKVDYSILVLGGFYIVVTAIYVLFEVIIINYRPILINGYLEASYPSSTTMLVMCVMPTAVIQLNAYVKNRLLRCFLTILIIVFIGFMVIGRLVSGVHWLTDIIGGVLLSAGLVMLYRAIISLKLV